MKLAILVSGPESSGQRYVRRALAASGCTHVHGWNLPPLDGVDRVVWGDSVPAGREPLRRTQDVGKAIEDVSNAGWDTRVILTTRHRWPMAMSQCNLGYVGSMTEAYASIGWAYTSIISGCMRTGTSFQVVPYESLVSHPMAMVQLIRSMGLEPGEMEPVHDGNKRWFDMHGA